MALPNAVYEGRAIFVAGHEGPEFAEEICSVDLSPVLQGAIDELNLEEYPEYNKALPDTSYIVSDLLQKISYALLKRQGDMVIRGYALDHLRRNTRLICDEKAGMVEIRVLSNKPDHAAAIANYVQEQYKVASASRFLFTDNMKRLQKGKGILYKEAVISYQAVRTASGLFYTIILAVALIGGIFSAFLADYFYRKNSKNVSDTE